VYLSVGDGPVAASHAAAVLEGETPSPALFAEAAAVAAEEEIHPDGDIHASAAYKRHLAGVLTRRALATAWERARGAGGVSRI
jgi:carbon-monoxide dehydrogenase medium subunit